MTARTAEVAGLRQARQAHLRDARPPVMLTWVRLVRMGWTPDSYAYLAALAEHAVAVQAALAEQGGRRAVLHATREDRLFAVARVLATTAETATSRGGTFEVVRPWLMLLASEQDAERYGALYGGLHAWRTREEIPRGFRSRVLPLADWTRTVGVLAPLAWAAGLTPVEAQERQHAGTLAAEDLLVLAGLRGYILPPLPSQ